MLSRFWIGILQIEFNFFVVILGANDNFPVRTPCGGDLSVEINGRGEYKSIVVICVLTDEIDSAGRAEKSGRNFITPRELFYEGILSTHRARFDRTEVKLLPGGFASQKSHNQSEDEQYDAPFQIYVHAQ